MKKTIYGIMDAIFSRSAQRDLKLCAFLLQIGIKNPIPHNNIQLVQPTSSCNHTSCRLPFHFLIIKEVNSIMAKRKRSTTRSVIARRIKEKRGQGQGATYKPWLTIHDVPSIGVVSRIKGWKTGRIHHLLSEHLETAYFYMCEWSPRIVDIREQFPLLPQEKTMFIADTLKIRYPCDPKTKEPIVITTDFMLTVQTEHGLEYWAHTVKPRDNLTPRTIEKFEIERRFFADEGVQWRLITDKDISYNLVKNVSWVHSARGLEGMSHLNESIIDSVEPELFNLLQSRSMSCSKYAAECDLRFGFPIGTSLFIVRHLIANKRWLVNMNRIIQPAMDPIDIKRA